MSTLEQRITETLTAHVANRPWSDSGVMKCSCGERFVAEYDYQQRALHQSHVAAMLAPLIREREAEAWDKGCGAGDAYGYQRNEFEHQCIDQLDTPTNPYRRSNDE